MAKIAYFFFFAAFAASTLSIPLYAEPEFEYNYDPEEVFEVASPLAEAYERVRRSLQPGAPNLPQLPGQDHGWSVNPTVQKDDGGNTRTNIEVQHKGRDHEFNAGWGKVVRGPAKAKPTFHVGGTFRW